MMDFLFPSGALNDQSIGEALRAAARAIDRNDLAEARIVAEVLLAQTLHLDRAGLYARLTETLESGLNDEWQSSLRRYQAGEPLAYLTGQREFYGLDLRVTPDVLIPRPETEQLVDRAIQMITQAVQKQEIRVADIGTGSGAIALALAAKVPGLRLWAVDLSTSALAVARAHAERLGLNDRVTFLAGDLANPLPEPVDLLLANLPYVASPGGRLEAETAGWEPDLALDGGPNGIRIIERLLATVAPKLAHPALILLEIGAGQGKPVQDLAERYLAPVEVTIHLDANGHDRLVEIATIHS